jgi:hypothetical protein
VVTPSAGLASAFAISLIATVAAAADHPLQGEFLRLSEHIRPGVARVRIGAVGALPAVESRSAADPRRTGAVLEVAGEQVLGADAPAVPLPAENWRALGQPPGSRGFRYFDAFSRFGVRQAALRFGQLATLSVAGGGRAWPYRAIGTPANVMVRFRIGDEVFCARFDALRRARGAAVAGHNSPPANCASDAD